VELSRGLHSSHRAFQVQVTAAKHGEPRPGERPQRRVTPSALSVAVGLCSRLAPSSRACPGVDGHGPQVQIVGADVSRETLTTRSYTKGQSRGNIATGKMTENLRAESMSAVPRCQKMSIVPSSKSLGVMKGPVSRVVRVAADVEPGRRAKRHRRRHKRRGLCVLDRDILVMAVSARWGTVRPLVRRNRPRDR
jgi:hypothetical protein